MDWVSFDTEFNTTQEKNLNPVCAALRTKDGVFSYWRDELDKFKLHFEKLVETKHFFIVFSAPAEYRFLLSIGYTREYLKQVRLIDIYPLWRILLFGISDYRYGKYVEYEKGRKITVVTRKPKEGERFDGEEYTDKEGNTVIFEDIRTRIYNPSLLHCCLRLLDVDISSEHKNKMRDLIIANIKLNKHKQEIMEYCEEDTKYLFPLFLECKKILLRYDKNFTFKDIKEMSKWQLNASIIESYGVPIRKDYVINFSNNHPKLDSELIKDCNKVFKFFREDKSKWVRDYSYFEDFVNVKKLNWPRTEKSQKFKQDKKTLEKFQSIPEINIFSKTLSARRELGYFKEGRVDNIIKNIGSDSYWRGSLMTYSSQTSRNQPKPTQGYIFTMSTWMRTLVDDSKVIIGADWSAQEIYLQAKLSGDKELMACYLSGDPYTWFAKKSGSLPNNVERKKGIFSINNIPVPENLQHQYSVIRNLFKAIMLGVGYGMGEDALALHLTNAKINSLREEDKQRVLNGDLRFLEQIRVVGKADRDNYADVRTALYYLNLHRKFFNIYHRWTEYIYKRDYSGSRSSGIYVRNRHLKLSDGWLLVGKETPIRSVRNFLVQGEGQVMLREAVDLLLDEGINIITTLHDAIYIESTLETKEKDINTLVSCMKKADPNVRVDAKVQKTDWENFETTWCDGKGEIEFKEYGKYFLTKQGIRF